MPKLHLTDLSVRSLQGSDDYISYWDDTTPGFGVRVGKRRKTFIVMRGKSRERITIGRYPDIGLSDARKKAKQLLSSEPTARNTRFLFEAARDEFLSDNYQGSTSSWPAIVKLIIHKHFKGLEGKQLSIITDDDIRRELEKVEGPSARLHAFRVARTFFTWATKPPRRYLTLSPMQGYDAPGTDKKRARILSDDELKAVWNASGEGSRRVFRLIILWGTRSAETALLRPSWRQGDVLTIPGPFTKNGRDHAIPILPLAQAELTPVNDFYFPGQKEGSLKPGSLHELRRDIQKDTGTSGWGAHDLRRTFRSNMARLGVPREICEVLLNHTPTVLDEIYDRYDRLSEKRDALARYEEFVLKLTSRG